MKALNRERDPGKGWQRLAFGLTLCNPLTQPPDTHQPHTPESDPGKSRQKTSLRTHSLQPTHPTSGHTNHPVKSGDVTSNIRFGDDTNGLAAFNDEDGIVVVECSIDRINRRVGFGRTDGFVHHVGNGQVANPLFAI